jgi:hypothetical protein
MTIVLTEKKICPMCKKKLTNSNVGRHNIPGTEKHKTIRLDSVGRPWCQQCTNEFDKIDWDEERNK